MKAVSFPSSEGFWYTNGDYHGEEKYFPQTSPAFPQASSAQISLNYTALKFGQAKRVTEVLHLLDSTVQ